MEIGGVHFDGRVTLLVILSTILPMVDYYNWRLTSLKPVDRFVLYFIIPLLIILLVFKERPDGYGLRLGDWRTGLLWTLAGCAGMGLILWFAARHPMASFYEQRAPTAPAVILLNAIEMWGWEFSGGFTALWPGARWDRAGYLAQVPLPSCTWASRSRDLHDDLWRRAFGFCLADRLVRLSLSHPLVYSLVHHAPATGRIG